MKGLIAAAGSGYEGKVWIGLFDRPRSWKWSLSDKGFYRKGGHTFMRWNTSGPNTMINGNELCVAVRKGVWYDYPCNNLLTFVCYDNANIHGE